MTDNRKRLLGTLEDHPAPKKPRRVTMDSGNTERARQKKKGWTKEEDAAMKRLVQEWHATKGNKEPKWTKMAQSLVGRTGKQCRERWYQHLRPGVVKGNWTAEEDALITKLQGMHGNKWSKIAESMPHRTDNDIKNRWNSKQKQEKNRATKLAAGGTASNATKRPTAKPKPIPRKPMGKQFIMGMQLKQVRTVPKPVHNPTTSFLVSSKQKNLDTAVRPLNNDKTDIVATTTPLTFESWLFGEVERDFTLPNLDTPTFLVPECPSPPCYDDFVPSSLTTPSPFVDIEHLACTPITLS